LEEIAVGSIVRCREREWIILPSDDRDIVRLRPLTGGESEICGIYKPLTRLGIDRIEPAQFPLPDPEQVGNAVGINLLFNASRLILHDGAGPFRSLGRISVRPRPYQFVPLLMALKLDPVRLLIADDVGVGKTIEALLIVRELLDRGEINRLCVLCPPYLCDQWQQELTEKFHIEAVVVRSGTIAQLERTLPATQSVFGYYPFIVVSIDYAKMDTHRANFLQHCPECVIVDEVHGAALPPSGARGQQQRHELLRKLVEKDDRHLLLLSATPHSGVESSFLSLLGLLHPQFEHYDLTHLTESQRDALARQFVQRRRVDVQKWIDEETPFPEREPQDESYQLSPAYKNLFNDVYTFSRQLIRTGETLNGWKQRIRYWTALALLRCVMSSPASAVAALEKRRGSDYFEEDFFAESVSPYVYDPTETEISDVQPAHIVEAGEKDLSSTEQKTLRAFAKKAQEILGTDQDTKLLKCVEVVGSLLQERFRPLIWCRYIATSEYLANQINQQLQKKFPNLRVVSVNGTLTDEERRARILELAKFPNRVCVATDCLSEGINLQEWFDAVVHYDLPWNPNRLEQRDGRVDRFGQRAKKVKSILIYGSDNPIDLAVLDVLLRKARQIHKTLGITVPVPVEEDTVMKAILENLFFRQKRVEQLSLFEDPMVVQFQRQLDDAVNREKESRTRFAQRSIKPQDVIRELEETDSVLGDSQTVRHFVLNALQKMGIPIKPKENEIFEISRLDQLPLQIRTQFHFNTHYPFHSYLTSSESLLIAFSLPTPENAVYLGRNHPLVNSLAQYLFEEAFEKGADAQAARCGAVRSNAVSKRTHLYLLRLRYSLSQPEGKSLFAEEVVPFGFRGSPSNLEWLSDSETLHLLNEVKPHGNLTPSEKKEFATEGQNFFQELKTEIDNVIENRRKRLEESHLRVRSSAGMLRRGLKVSVHRPADLLGYLVILPCPQGVRES
jgi:superfamily II DNA or RNA helicase